MRPIPESTPPARFRRAVREHPLAAFLLTAPPAWRVTTFRVLAALGGCVFLVPLQQAISPWGAVTLSNTDGVTDVNLHRWSAALAGGPDAALAALLFYLAWRPMRAQLVLQWAALAAIVFLAANVPFAGPAVAVYAIPVVLVLARSSYWWMRPERWSFRSAEPVSWRATMTRRATPSTWSTSVLPHCWPECGGQGLNRLR